MKTFSLANLPLGGKITLVREDYNVLLEKGKVLDNSRIKFSLPTIKFLLRKNCKIVLATHLGRPEGKAVPGLRTDCLAEELERLLGRQVIKLGGCFGKEIKKKIKEAKSKQIFLLENLRFYKEEEQNDKAFAASLAELADFYVNDAFSVSHRGHASVEAITRFLPAAPGLLMAEEIKQLSKALHPEKPLVWVFGGAKLDKVELINQALKKADFILVGGALAFSFLKANGFLVGKSKVDEESVKAAKEILKRDKRGKIILPVDAVVASDLKSKARIVRIDRIKEEEAAFDIGPETVKLFESYLKKAKTIVWNGPLGYFEKKPFEQATKNLGVFISRLKATKIIGGGETSAAIYQFKLAKKMTYVSMSGGAALEFLSGKKLPGIKALEMNYKKFGERMYFKES